MDDKLQQSLERLKESKEILKQFETKEEAIEFLEKHGIVQKLSSRLQDAINLRKEYPDSSLSELSELSSNVLGKEMSKSGISHCMREIMKVYEYYLEKGSKNV